MFASQWGTKSLRRAGVLRIRWYLRRRCISEAGSCSWGTGSQDAPRFLFWEFHAYRLSHDCARLLICGISGLQKGTSGWKEGFAATAHQALSGARANFLRQSSSASNSHWPDSLHLVNRKPVTQLIEHRAIMSGYQVVSSTPAPPTLRVLK